MSTVLDAVTELHSKYGATGTVRQGWLGGQPRYHRVLVHDGLHTIFRNNVTNYRGEIAGAITHAVLERCPNVSRQKEHRETNRNTRQPTLKDITEITVKEIIEYLDDDRTRRLSLPAKKPKLLSEEEIANVYYTARLFDAMITKEFGKPFCEIPADELKTMNFEQLQAMADKAKDQVHHKRLSRESVYPASFAVNPA